MVTHFSLLVLISRKFISVADVWCKPFGRSAEAAKRIDISNMLVKGFSARGTRKGRTSCCQWAGIWDGVRGILLGLYLKLQVRILFPLFLFLDLVYR